MRFILTSILAFAGSIAFAKEVPTLVVATGPEKSTYSRMFKELGKICQDVAYLKEVKTSGFTNFSFTNIKNAPILPKDIDLFFEKINIFRAKRRSKKNNGLVYLAKILLPLHSEYIYVLTNGNKNNIERLKTVGFLEEDAGVVTAIALSLGIEYKNKIFRNRREAILTVKDNYVDAFIVTASKYEKWINDLKGLRNIPVPWNQNMGEFFHTKKASKETNFTMPLVRNAIIVHNTNDPVKRKLFLKYQDCVSKNIHKLQKGPKTAPEWKDIKLDILPNEIYK